MFYKKPTATEIENEKKKVLSLVPNAVEVGGEVPVREYMIKWLSSFFPDMTYADAKSYCLPRRMYKNYLWHSFTFQYTDSPAGADAVDAAQGAFSGKCFVLMCETNTLFCINDGTVLTPENVETLGNAVVFDKDYTRTYVHTGKEDVGPFYKSAAQESDCGE